MVFQTAYAVIDEILLSFETNLRSSYYYLAFAIHLRAKGDV